MLGAWCSRGSVSLTELSTQGFCSQGRSQVADGVTISSKAQASLMTAKHGFLPSFPWNLLCRDKY